MPKPKGERVAMVWPKELKDAVREYTGDRGITTFTVKAVQDRLDGRSSTSDLSEARRLAQRLADAIADGESPEFLRQVPMPRWIEASRWPVELRPPHADSDQLPFRRNVGLRPSAATRVKRCSQCREPLVGGECWTCE